MFALYATAGQGDRASARRLAKYPSPEAMPLIEKLAQDRNAFADGRLEAISILGEKDPIESKTLTPLLWIDQPFAIRHATAKIFQTRGCGEACIAATLAAVRAIWLGQLANEDRAASQIPSPTLDDQEYFLYLHRQRDEDYWGLLNINGCVTRHVLRASGFEPAFVKQVESKLQPC